MSRRFKQGDPVVYRMPKFSTRPGPRAQDVSPSPQGELYTYEVDKFWVVADLKPDGKVLLRTRRGKEHLIEADNPRLRHANWWERLVYRGRFPQFPAEHG